MYKLFFVIAAAVIAGNEASALARQGSFNKYFLYTVNNTRSAIELDLSNITAAAANLLATRNTTIIVHGHEGSAISSLNPTVKDAFLASEDIDVIVVDWSVYASLSYSNAVNAVPSVGSYVANLITQLVNESVVSLDKLHLVGFNLGAHVVGYAGRALDGKVARITGLDPSGNQWGSNSLRLRRSDALYVEVIHTNGVDLLGHGIGDAIGDVDIYVNGGGGQPGCLLNNLCSHNRAWEVFAASLEYDHLIASQCGSWLQVTLNTCRGRTLAIGNNDFVKLGTGMYRVNTRRSYPY